MAAKTYIEQIVDLFNAANPGLAHALVAADIDAANPSNVVGSDGVSSKNTEMTITAKSSSTYFTGTATLQYNRILLNFGSEASETALTDEQFLAKLNAKLTAAKYTDQLTLAELDLTKTAESITASVKANHLKFQSGNFYTVTLPVVKKDLATTTVELNGFTAPA